MVQEKREGGTKFMSKIRISEESREEETLGIAFRDLERDEIT